MQKYIIGFLVGAVVILLGRESVLYFNERKAGTAQAETRGMLDASLKIGSTSVDRE